MALQPALEEWLEERTARAFRRLMRAKGRLLDRWQIPGRRLYQVPAADLARFRELAGDIINDFAADVREVLELAADDDMIVNRFLLDRIGTEPELVDDVAVEATGA